LQAPVLVCYAREDVLINGGVPSLEAELMAQQKDYKLVTYPGASHPFFNDTGSRYRPDSAEAVWMRSLDWFEDHLMGT
jgi:carboxymethylenebutenolidase